MSNKTEQPTPKRLREARKRGQIAFSRDVPSVATYFAGLVLILMWAGRIRDGFAHLYRTVIQSAVRIDGSHVLDPVGPMMREASLTWLFATLPIIAAVAIAGVVMAVVQTGLLLTAEPMKPSFRKINPLEGLKRWFSIRGIVEFLKTLIKVGLVVFLGYRALAGSMAEIMRLHLADLPLIFAELMRVGRAFAFQVGMAFIGVAAVDYFFQRKQWKKQLMMTREEVKQEYKEMEGDPLIKSQRRALHQQMVMASVVREVPRADAVVVNPSHIAVAIRYDRKTMGAPKVTVKGRGRLAHRIIQLARQYEVPIVRDIALAHALYKVEEDEYIPKDLYESVAEVLIFAWRLKQEAQRGFVIER